MGSKRLPGKVLMNLLGKPMLAWQINSLKKLEIPLIVATTVKSEDDCIEDLAIKSGLQCIRGSEHDVFERFAGVRAEYPMDNYVRITGDCPLLSPIVLKEVLEMHERSGSDYSSNTLIRSFPDGLDVEIFTDTAFHRLMNMELSEYQREHVTPGFYQNPQIFKLVNLLEERNLGHWRWTVDDITDFKWLERLLLSMDAVEIPEYDDIFKFIVNSPKHIRTQSDIQNV